MPGTQRSTSRSALTIFAVALIPVASAVLFSCELVEEIGSISYAEAGAESGHMDGEASDIYDAGPVDETIVCPRDSGAGTSLSQSFLIDASALLAKPIPGSDPQSACIEARAVNGAQYDQFLEAGPAILAVYAAAYATSSACDSPGHCTFDVVKDAGFLTPTGATNPKTPVTGVAPCAAELFCWSLNRSLCPKAEWMDACKLSATESKFSRAGLELSFDTSCLGNDASTCETSCTVVGADNSCAGGVPCHEEMRDVAFRCCAAVAVSGTCPH